MASVASIQAVVADHYHVPRCMMTSRTQARPAVRARQVAMYLAHTVLGKGPTEIGRRFNRDHSTVSHAFRIVAASPELRASVKALRARLGG